MRIYGVVFNRVSIGGAIVMSKAFSSQNSTWKKAKVPHGKHHNKTETKTTVSLYLNKKLS
jgi:hypothetical protein